jgi:hypothetical protein
MAHELSISWADRSSRLHTRRHAALARGALVTALSLLASSVALPGCAQAPPTSGAAQPAADTTATTAEPPVDGGWPRASTTTSGASLVVYQPQIASWADQKQVVIYAAVSYTPKGAQKAALGTIRAESATSVATAQRLVSFSEFRITESNFATLPREQVRAVVAEIAAAVPLDERVIALDRVLANLDTSQIIPKNIEGVKADPPPIFFSQTPAVLLNVDGDPIWSAIQGNDLQFAVNTNWDLFQHTPTKTWYLRATDTWLKAPALQGPWTYAGLLPDSFYKLPNDPNWKDAKGALPGKKIAPSDAPRVFATTAPAELILVKGEPTYAPVTGTAGLLWVSNSDSDVFRMTRTGPVYVLTSGRWFSAPDFSGPWTFASPALPADFKKIPLEHDRSRVLASVPGTPEAAEAVLLAQIPETATVGKDLKAPPVLYQGTPEFQPIETTTVQRAVNTDKDILKIGDLYYMCFQGVWFMSRTPTGPWEVTGDVPKAIYTIPVSSPSYSVTYVVVQSATPTTVVYVASPAYSGMMVAFGVAVWGTGYYYPPYVYRGGVYPVYYPHYPTYGYAAAYNPWTGAYTRGAVAYGPYGGAGAAARYNPSTGVYSRGAVAYGPNGAAGAAQAYNPRTGAYGQTAQGSNAYGSWGSTSVQRGDQWANTQRTTNNATGVTTRTTQSSAGSSARVTGPGGQTSAVAKSNSGDLYAGHDGNVYKKDASGGYQKYDNGSWNSVQQPTQAQKQQAQSQASARASGANSATMSQVQSDAAARTSGTQRTNTYSRGGGGSSYRPSGGGGGRRR